MVIGAAGRDLDHGEVFRYGTLLWLTDWTHRQFERWLIWGATTKFGAASSNFGAFALSFGSILNCVCFLLPDKALLAEVTDLRFSFFLAHNHS